MVKFSMILAVDEKNGIGVNGTLPWRIKADMDFFQKTTVITQNPDKINAVIMGRKTWDSIPSKYKPLPGRLNFVLTRNENSNSSDAIFGNSLDEIFSIISLNPSIEKVFIIGGSYLYNEVLDDPRLEDIYLTEIIGDFNCDTFFQGIPDSFFLRKESPEYTENNIRFHFRIYSKNKVQKKQL
ncbi:MAG: dihydrofolate reductase [Candidatus Gracilibacteria bacterium]|nr:dihydrofolate reductase [Candidatus Gracilibacteria bacterium]